MNFTIEKKIDGALGRAGTLETAHGAVHTPAFVPVGTKASVKALTPEMVRDLGAEIVLGNTYHLYLQPGDELVRDAGGIGAFMNWRRADGAIAPTMTDSGGFQVFSLGAAYGKEISKVVKITDPSLLIPERFDDKDAPRLAKVGQDGVSFKSHLDGSIHYITPEKSIEIQHNLGADIIFAFDECTSPAEDLRYQSEALDRTHRWAERSLEAHVKLKQENARRRSHSVREGQDSSGRSEDSSEHFPALFGIVQGGRDEGLRKKSAEVIGGMDFDGFGIGGSFAKEDMSTAVAWVNAILPEAKPRHLLGIGEPEDIFMGVENGVDLFDCVAPTRNARNGSLYTRSGKINILNVRYRTDFSPVEEGCGCYTCKNFTRAYLAHLFHGKEMLAATLASAHNLYFLSHLMQDIRQSILDGRFAEFKKAFLGPWQGGGEA